MTVQQNKMLHGYLVGRPYPRDTHENQLSPSCPDSSHSNHVQCICITSRDVYSRVSRGMIVLEFLLVMLLVRRWKMCPQMSISLCVKRSYKKIVIGADNVVKFVTRYKLWIITYAKVLISRLNGIVFMKDFLSVPPRMVTISSIDSKWSSYCTVIGCEGGQTSKNSCMLSLVITNSLCLAQQFICSPSTLAFEKNSLTISDYTTPLGFNSFVHVLSLNTSGMQVSSRVSNFTTLSMIIMARLYQPL